MDWYVHDGLFGWGIPCSHNDVFPQITFARSSLWHPRVDSLKQDHCGSWNDIRDSMPLTLPQNRSYSVYQIS
ncbi:hypothetical protein AcV7_004766 [Taiwanofungus camphoratus]|nr:hypothetical protein AcV7_004766 [Antrodia cinnamomea]